jgi:2,3-diaminopropionate biosynthesis protein SbnB
MLYLNESHLEAAGTDWRETVAVIERAVSAHDCGEFSQPIKPYLRYGDRRNRIIAMPAYLGGNVERAGIKWIASFPGNLSKGLPRAHSVVILNNAATGEPEAIINGAALSVIRTASVSGLVVKHAFLARPRRDIRVGITGFGPIGRNHLLMCEALLGDAIGEVSIFDVRRVDPAILDGFASRPRLVGSWSEAYDDADFFITCTVADAPYIDRAPKPGSIHLNVSLRDYKASAYPHFRAGIVVDDWEEVCRENTDVEMMHKHEGLTAEGTCNLGDVALRGWVKRLPPDSPLLFNPMGMAIFDIAIADYYVGRANAKSIGIGLLP